MDYVWCMLALAAVVVGSPVVVVDITNGSELTLPTVLAVQTCAGLLNRDDSPVGPAYVLMSARDSLWLEMLNINNLKSVSVHSFLDLCFRTVAKGHILYDYKKQQAVVPSLVSLAAVLDAVPLEQDSPFSSNTTLIFDSVVQWDGFGPYEAASFMLDHHVNSTTNPAKMNPGFDWTKSLLNPPLTGSPDFGLVDYIVKDRLFNFYLPFGCVPLTREHSLMKRIATENPWPRPIAVFGYDDTIPLFGGDVFEAETTCVNNMGQVATSGVNNLAFFSRAPPITSPLLQNPAPTETYNASRTYLAIVIGDGDNVAFVKSSRMGWFLQRITMCNANPTLCFPLLWSISPHLFTLAPDWLRWYYAGARQTGTDFFVLPPSGHLYAYPSLMDAANQAAFVAATERDCALLNTSASTAWEVALSWPNALSTYFPRYGAHGVVRAFFAVNVPYLLPALAFGDAFYKVVGAERNVVVFRPREWRGGDGSSSFEYNASQMAAEVNKYPAGTVTHLYVTSDGGADLSLVMSMVPQLGEHVRVVNHQALADLALQREAWLEQQSR